MLSLITIKRTKDLVKTGMCKINESPCLLQLKARCFFLFFCPPRGVEWLFLQHGLGYSYIPVFTKILLFYRAPQRSEKSRLFVYMRWSVRFAHIVVVHAVAFFSICDLEGAPPLLQHNKDHPLQQTLYRQNNFNRSLCMSAASISSLLVNFHPVHSLVR